MTPQGGTSGHVIPEIEKLTVNTAVVRAFLQWT